jgi:hypothetical protein
MFSSTLADIGKSQFATIMKMPIVWIHTANGLWHAAEVLLTKSAKAKARLDGTEALRRTHSLSRTEMRLVADWNLFVQAGFLFGLAIENY